MRYWSPSKNCFVERNHGTESKEETPPRLVWDTPKDAPCHSCVPTLGKPIGCTYCKNNCPYWPKLLKMRDDGLLERVVT